jgi:NADPH:quinone reductase-like Zn-dependent oxidoreductase
MDAAVLQAYGAPRFGSFPDPMAGGGTTVVRVAAAAISRFDIDFAAGRHMLKPSVLPTVAGREGVGFLADGRRVYFDAPVSPYGSMAQRTLVAEHGPIEVPDGVDDAVAAALGNSGLAAWLPLTWRAQLAAGETVLVLGATGIVGRLAVQAAKLLGAGRVVAAGRDAGTLCRTRALGADATVPLDASKDLAGAFRTAAQGPVDVVVDYLWGPALEAAVQAAGVGARLVQVGQAGADEVHLSAATARAKSMSILGYATYHAPRNVRAAAYRHLAELAGQGQLVVDVQPVALRFVEQAWHRQHAGSRQRLVLLP